MYIVDNVVCVRCVWSVVFIKFVCFFVFIIGVVGSFVVVDGFVYVLIEFYLLIFMFSCIDKGECDLVFVVVMVVVGMLDFDFDGISMYVVLKVKYGFLYYVYYDVCFVVYVRVLNNFFINVIEVKLFIFGKVGNGVFDGVVIKWFIMIY